MKERTLLAIKLITSHIALLPLALLISFFVVADCDLLIFVIQTLLIIILLTGYWEFFGLEFRIIYGSVVEAIILVLLYYKLTHEAAHEFNLALVIFLGITEIWLIYELVKICFIIFKRDNKSLEMDFPVKNGRYLITDGGNSKLSQLMNYHYYSTVHRKNRTNDSMKFAADVVKIDTSGKPFLPPANLDYPIFGEKIYSPISGIVIDVENDVRDNIPYSGNYPYNTGNTVVIRQGDYCFLIGHLMKGSVNVKVGDYVNVSELIAAAGNSGFSERPHIHMQLIDSPNDDYWHGTGVGISYRGRNIYKNRIIDIR